MLAALALASLALVVPAGGSLGAQAALAMGSLPACRYDDILTAPRQYKDWKVTLVDPILRIPRTYAPPDLVSTNKAGLLGGGVVRSFVIADLKAMADAARDAGAPIAVQSAYRSYAQQQATFAYWTSALGYDEALKVSARPGHSEHQLGVAIDFRSERGGAPWSGGDWAATPAGAWMHANAWQFGWILSYTKNAFATVCYSYEPWHYRYVGREVAEQIHASGLTTRAFLWAGFTTAVVGKPQSPAPRRTVSPSATPTASSAPKPTDSAPKPTDDVEPTLQPTQAPTGGTPDATAPGQAVSTGPRTITAEPTSFVDSQTTIVIGIGLVIAIGGGLLMSGRRRGTG